MLNIKDPRAHELAKELAAIEGTSMTGAVVDALQRAVDAHRTRRDERLAVLSRIIESARARGLTPTTDPFADLYDEDGLPA